MSFVGYIDLVSLIFYIVMLFLLLSRWKNSFSTVLNRIMLILVILFILHTISNVLEWLFLVDAADTYGDYAQILEPVLWFFFFVTYIQEMTEKRQVESERKYRHLFETSPFFIGLVDSKRVLIDCNNVVNEILMIKTKWDIIGKNITELFSINKKNTSLIPIFEKLIKNLFGGVKTNQKSFNFQLYVGKRKPFWLEVESTLVEFKKQKLIQFILQDITERKKAEKELIKSEKRYRDAYNRAEFYKDIFTHDINNILQSILSGTQINQILIDDPEKFADLKLNEEIIKEQVIRGAELVKNVRKLSKLEEAGQNLEKIEFLAALKNTISFVKKSYKNKNLTIKVVSIEENLFTMANSFLNDVFENLIINAISHNKNLIIEIIIKISKEQDLGISYHKIEFSDNGIGVDDSMKQKIFQRGYSKEKGDYGMGLGLTLVRRIIDTYNGKIWVEDRVRGDRSKGSNFVLLIPEVD